MQQRSCLHTKVCTRTLGEPLSPLPPRQLALNGSGHYVGYSLVALKRVPAQALMKVVGDVVYV